eukprot:1304391-Ditylum_brightwellii.AAC.1
MGLEEMLFRVWKKMYSIKKKVDGKEKDGEEKNKEKNWILGMIFFVLFSLFLKGLADHTSCELVILMNGDPKDKKSSRSTAAKKRKIEEAKQEQEIDVL